MPAKILYLQWYSTDFRNLCLGSKLFRVVIWVEGVSCGGILLLQWQGENLHIFNIWNFAHFNLYTVPAKILYLQKYSTDFRNLCLSSKMLRVGIWVESFRCAGVLLLQWQGENFAHRQHLKFCRFQPVQCTLCQRKSYISNGIQPIFEIFATARKCWGWAFGWKVLSAQGFYLCNARWKLCASTTFEILPLSTCTLCQQKSCIPKVFIRFSKSLPQLEDVAGGHLGGKF